VDDDEEEQSTMDDLNGKIPESDEVEQQDRKRVSSGYSNLDSTAETANIVGLALEVPGAIANGIQGIGRGLTGLVNKAGIGGDKTSQDGLTESGNGGGFDAGSVTNSIGSVVSTAGDGISKVAGAAGDGIGFVAGNAGAVVSGAGEALSGAANVAGSVLSAVGDVAGPVASAAGDVAGAAGEAAGAVLGSLGDLDF
jgi:hypothetical protein